MSAPSDSFISTRIAALESEIDADASFAGKETAPALAVAVAAKKAAVAAMLQTILVADKRFKHFCILLGITAKYYTISAAVKSKAGEKVEVLH
mgnify:CR=1 FL=1